MKIPHLETVQSMGVVPETKLPVGLNLMTSVGKKDAPRAFEIHSWTALLQIDGRAPAAASTHS